MTVVQPTEAPLVERERELEALDRVLAGARRGEGAALVVEGPAGIGKSRLLAAAAAAADSLEVLRARGSELERDFPFGVVRQLLEPVLFRADEPERERLLAGAGALSRRVLVASTADGGNVADAYAALHGLYWFTANLAEARPVLLLVDDAQWADAASLRWLAFLLHRLDGMAVGVVLALRTGETALEEAALDELLAVPDIAFVRPGALSRASITRLIELRLGQAPDAAFAAACDEATGGNPFLLRELVGELAARDVVPRSPSAAIVADVSAGGVARAVRARLRHLPAGCLEFARAVSVLGDGCELPVAADLAQLDHPEALQAADALAAASVLEPSRPLAFVHPLVRASVYGELAAGERSNLHARAGRALLDTGADADRVALHLLATDPAGDADTTAVLRAAAASASGRGAHDVAATYLARALREPPAPSLEPQLLRELGTAELQTGEIEAAVEHLSRALDATTAVHERAPLALALANGLLFTNRAADAVDVLTDALEEVGDAEPELTARLMAMQAVAGWSALAAHKRMPPEPAVAVATDAAPQTTGERLHLARRAIVEMLTGTAAEARSLALRALGDGELLEATGTHYPPFYLALNALTWAHAIADADSHSRAALADARRCGSALGFAITSHFRTAIGWQRGALLDVEADARSALAQNAPYAFPLAAVHLGDALVERGDPEGAVAQLRAAGLDAEPPPPLIGVLALVARARIHAAQQRPHDALELLFECGRIEDAWDVRTPSLTSWRAEAALLLDRLDEPERARDLAAEAVARAEGFGSPSACGIAFRAAGLVDHPTDEERLDESVQVLRGSGARLELARSLVDLGAARRRSGRRADARDPLREGLTIALDCGASVLAERAHNELVAAGARPRRDPIESRSTLTASELRVARMAAEGLTNREIAQALFLTSKTIEVHLTHVYRKLEIQSRSQLTRALPAAAVSA